MSSCRLRINLLLIIKGHTERFQIKKRILPSINVFKRLSSPNNASALTFEYFPTLPLSVMSLTKY